MSKQKLFVWFSVVALAVIYILDLNVYLGLKNSIKHLEAKVTQLEEKVHDIDKHVMVPVISNIGFSGMNFTLTEGVPGSERFGRWTTVELRNGVPYFHICTAPNKPVEIHKILLDPMDENKR
jgi:hypothetical protein